MVNELREGDNLIPVDYSSILQQIMNKLPEQNLFKISSDRRSLLINIDIIAGSVTKTKVENPLTETRFVRSATVNFANEQEFGNKIREIKDCLKEHLKLTVGAKSLVDFIDTLTTNLESFQGKANKLGLFYPFNEAYTGLQTQELILDHDRNGTDSVLKFAKLIIKVQNTQQFQSQLKEGVKNHMVDYYETDDEQEIKDIYHILENQIKDESSEFNLLQRLADRETLGKLKKEAIIIYLEYISKNLDIKNKNTEGFIYLQDLIGRLRLIEEYINSKAYGELEVYYGGVTVNYQDVFSRGEAFDALPIIPTVEGNLGESRDRETGEIQFTLGLKLKFNGKVQTDRGQTSFEYNLDIINPNHPEHQAKLTDPDTKSRESFARKVLIRVFLYYFVFACDKPSAVNDELNYDPIPKFEQVLTKLRGNNYQEKKGIFRGIIRGFKERGIQEKLNSLRQLLINFIDRKEILPICHENRQISISREILNKDSESISTGDFFQEDLREAKKCLKYISIDNTGVNVNAVCQLPVTIKIEDIRYFKGESTPQNFQLEYNIEGIKILPIFWIPNTNPCLDYYQKYFEPKYKHILLSYNNQRLNQDQDQEGKLDSTQAFVYRFTWILLSYLCLYILLEEYLGEEKKLFISMVRLHQGTSENPFPAEKFLANLSKLLCHIFSQKYRCNSQGFRVHKPPKSFNIKNGLNSLYSVLPKKFSLTDNSPSPQLEKLGIIIISSRESDAKRDNKNRKDRIATLIGEVVSLEKLEDGSVKIQPLTTFYNNYPLRKMYRQPPILTETVNDLYYRGYRDFLYIAQAPYTSTLHITQKEEDEELYFMSASIIKAMKQGKKNIKIYPAFFDKYYVRRLKGLNINSLYIQDTRQLTNIAEDSRQEAVMFFNLFNGISVGNDRFYHGVISYSTLLGQYYTNVMDDADIRQALVLETPLKNDILQYLKFFHFSRYEKQGKISLKLDPYQNIIGDEAIGALSIFPHVTEKINFNGLAFLTEVSKIVDVDF